jgi:hypothetical protein
VKLVALEYFFDGYDAVTFPLMKTIGPRNHWPTHIPGMQVSGSVIKNLNAGNAHGLFLIGKLSYVNALEKTVDQYITKRGTIEQRERTRLTGDVPGDAKHFFETTRAGFEYRRREQAKKDQPGE